MNGDRQQADGGKNLYSPHLSQAIRRRFMALVRHSKQLAGLLANALEQNRLLLDERQVLLERIQWLEERRRMSREKELNLLSFLLDLHLEGSPDSLPLELSQAIGRAMELDSLQLWRLNHAARLYPLGLFHVPGEHHQKEELCFSSTLEHIPVQIPLASARILEDLDGMKGLAAVLHHLGERWDGSGGPDGLKGRRIPLESRILSAVLAYHAGIRKSESPSHVLRRMRSESLWDPAVLGALQDHVDCAARESVMRIRLWDLAPGMELAAPIHARAGAMLLPEGTCITEHHLKQLLAYSRSGPLDDMVMIRGKGRP